MKSTDKTLLLILTGFCVLFILYKLVSFLLNKDKAIANEDSLMPDDSKNIDTLVEISVETKRKQIDNECICYYYKVTEESKVYGDIYPPITLFNQGNLLREKFNALDWYNRRKETLELKQQLFGSEKTSFILKLYLVKKVNEGEVEYLMIDESGLRNEENTFFEGKLLESLGYNKLSDPYQDNDPIVSKNSYLKL